MLMRLIVFLAAGGLLVLFGKLGINTDAVVVIGMIVAVLVVPAVLLFIGVMKVLEIRRHQEQARQDAIRRDIAQGSIAPRLRQAVASGDVKFVEFVGGTDRKGMWAAFTADADGNTPDHLAAMNGHAAMIETLANMGLVVIDRNKAGKTMLDVAPPARAAAISAAFCRGYARYLLRNKLPVKDPRPDDRAAIEQWLAELAERRHTMTARQISFEVSADDFVRRLLARSLAASAAGESDRALGDADLAARLAPQSPDALARRAAARVDTRDFPGALADANEAVRLAPADAQHYETRAALHEKMGDTDSAMKDYEKAIELDPSRTRAQERYNELIASA
jgi:hypothetical protein